MAQRVFTIAGEASAPGLRELVANLGVELERAGLRWANEDPEPGLVINLFDPDSPRSYRRRGRGTFVAGLCWRESMPRDIEKALRLNYPLLVRTLSNIVLCFVPDKGVWFTTMERGHYLALPEDGQTIAEATSERLLPLALSRLVIDNDFRTDLEPELWEGDEVTEEIKQAGVRLGDLDLLPAPFPIEELLDERDLRHLIRLYGVGGLSYGNLSARKDARRFWMSASGVDKSRLEVPGRDILLVSGYDAENVRMILSVPPDVEPRRVSVDAIEHWMIYQAHPDVGAILHVHAWMEGIQATQINFPCGTEELAVAVADLVAQEPNPAEAVIGLRNHGITATGPSLTEILDRIEPYVLRQVPMA